MKSVLISIQPKWCELIANGKKTIEVRKTRPNLEVPFKCYIYQTKLKFMFNTLRKIGLSDLANKLFLGKGKVIGEFVCDDIDTIAVFNDRLFCVENSQANKLKQMCLTIEEIKAYLGVKNQGYNWHISRLVIYDKPKELCKFHRPCADIQNCLNKAFREAGRSLDKCSDCGCEIKRPPQSWCYVESGV